MFYSNTLNLIQVGGGTQVKQGDLGSRFSYKLANEKEQELDDFNEEVAHINLVLDDKIVFTTTATVDNSTVTFNIDKAIPVGLYFLEIKIRDYIFPSDKQTIIFVQSGAVAYDLKELVPNYDTNMTIAGILSDLSQKGIDINDLKAKMNAIYNNALADHAEITAARGSYPELRSRLDELEKTSAITLDSVQEMKKCRYLKEGNYVKTSGYYNVNDGGGALYKIVDTKGNNYYEDLDNGLYALIIIEKRVRPEMFGAVGDGVTDDTAAFKRMFTLNENCYIPNKIFRLSEPITIPPHCSLIGDTYSRLLNNYRVKKSVLKFDVTSSNVTLVSGDTVSCENICIISNSYSSTEDRTKHSVSDPLAWFTTSTRYENVNGFNVYKAINCTCIGASGNGFTINYGIVENCTTEFCKVGFNFGSDSQGTLLRAYYVETFLMMNSNNNVSNTRADSVYGVYCRMDWSGNTLTNVSGDYIGEELFYLRSGGNNISNVYCDRYGLNHIKYTEDEYINEYTYDEPSTWYMIKVYQMALDSSNITNLAKCGGPAHTDNNLYCVNGLVLYEGGVGQRRVGAISFGMLPSQFFKKRPGNGSPDAWYTDSNIFNINDFKKLVAIDRPTDIYSAKNRCPMVFETQYGIVNALKMTCEFKEENLSVDF